MSFKSLSVYFLCITCCPYIQFPTIVQAHSWIDCISHQYDQVYTDSWKYIFTGQKGHGVCDGYGRNYPGRGNTAINQLYTYKISHQDVEKGHPVCQFNNLDGTNYNEWRKMITAKPGDKLYFSYLPNGHISKDKLARTTTYGIYWSGQPDTQLKSTTELNGHLLDNKLYNFDDGNCGETFEDGDFNGGTIRSGRAGDGKPCIGNFDVPKEIPSGKYQFIWFWTFYRTDNTVIVEKGFYGAAYSTCFDINVVNDNNEEKIKIEPLPPVPEPMEEEKEKETEEDQNLPMTQQSAGCSGFHGPCFTNGVQYSCTQGSTCKSWNQHYAQCIPDVSEYGRQCGGEAGCSVGWICKEYSSSWSGCVPAPAFCSNQVTPNQKSPEEKKSEETKPEEIKPEEIKPEEIKPEEKKPEEIKPEEKKPEEMKPEEMKPEEMKLEEKQPEAPKPEEIQPEEIKQADPPKFSFKPETKKPEPITPNPFISKTLKVDKSITYTNVGGKGSYGRVTEMIPGIFGRECPPNACVQQDHLVEGPLAPFDEEITLVLRGPMVIDNIAVYEPNDSNYWVKVSSYAKGKSTNNMIFMNNLGGKESGEWTTCGGNSQSYASYSGEFSTKTPSVFNGILGDWKEVNIMTGQKCDSVSCGFHRANSYHGWKGSKKGDKMMIIRAQMPHSTGRNEPALWILNAAIVRTAQYGCNCRGLGVQGRWKGGCGELDVAEILSGNHEMLTSTLYSFKGGHSVGQYGKRPYNTPSTFIVIFDSSNNGRIKILKVDSGEVEFENNGFQDATVKEWLEIPGHTVSFKK